MTERSKTKLTFGALVSTIIGVLVICGYIWGSASKVQELEDCCASATADVVKIEQSVNKLESNIDAQLTIIHSDIKQILRNSR
jgi:hypothetical protein